MKSMIKKYCYIGAFGFLGFLVSMLLHGMIEIPTLALTTGEAGEYGNNWVWQNWETLHQGVSIVITLLGVGGGLYLGQRFWQILYVEKLYGTPRW